MAGTTPTRKTIRRLITQDITRIPRLPNLAIRVRDTIPESEDRQGVQAGRHPIQPTVRPSVNIPDRKGRR